MPRWGRFDGITAEVQTSDTKPDGVGWFEVTVIDDTNERIRDVLNDWHCHICGLSRPDSAISVAKHIRLHPRDSEDEVYFAVQDNVRFCNDNPDCRTKARFRDHAQIQLVKALSLNDEMMAEVKKFKWWASALVPLSFLLGAGVMGYIADWPF